MPESKNAARAPKGLRPSKAPATQTSPSARPSNGNRRPKRSAASMMRSLSRMAKGGATPERALFGARRQGGAAQDQARIDPKGDTDSDHGELAGWTRSSGGWRGTRGRS